MGMEVGMCLVEAEMGDLAVVDEVEMVVITKDDKEENEFGPILVGW